MLRIEEFYEKITFLVSNFSKFYEMRTSLICSIGVILQDFVLLLGGR